MKILFVISPDQSKTIMKRHIHHFIKEKSPLFESAVQTLKIKGHLIIMGPQGSGRTTLGYALLHHYSHRNYIPLILREPLEWQLSMGGDEKNIVLLNCLSKNDSSDKILKKWCPHFNCMIDFAKSGKCLTVIILHNESLKDRSQEYHKLLNQFPMVNLELFES